MTKPTLIGALIAVVLLAATACENAVEESLPPGPPGSIDPAPPSKRPPPARSGIGSDPDNPNGAPGPSTIGGGQRF
jgi:hypothetical protein